MNPVEFAAFARRKLRDDPLRRRRLQFGRTLLFGLCLAGALGLAVASNPIHPLVGCSIKGNVSIDTGERIYHVPGQRYYEETVIDPAYDERWFCSEAEARAAGWRKSKV